MSFGAAGARSAAEKPPRCFGAHAPHLPRRLLRALGRVLLIRSLTCSAAPCSWGTWPPNPSWRFSPALLGGGPGARRGRHRSVVAVRGSADLGDRDRTLRRVGLN